MNKNNTNNTTMMKIMNKTLIMLTKVITTHNS